MSRQRYLEVGCLVGMAAFAVAVIYPVFARAHAKASQEACKSNVEQLTLSVLLYAADNDQRLPNTLVWASALQPYYRNDQTLVCRGDVRLSLFDQIHLDDDNGPARLGFISYEMLQGRSYQKLPPRAQAGHAIILYEAGRHGLEYRHFGGMFVGFLDGHQRWYPRSETTPQVILGGSH